MKFNYDPIELQELINETNEAAKSLRPGAIEKDFYVTQLIHALSDVKNDYFSLTFVGGTALAKCHLLVSRMSEDCDFRIQTLPKGQELNKTQFRLALKDFRHQILDNLKGYGFTIPDENIKVRDEGNYMKTDIPYQSFYERSSVLRPHIQLEFIAINTKLPVEHKEVTTLIRQLLGDTVQHESKLIECIAIPETAADKWVALTRRVANTLHRPPRSADGALVRHLFDLHYINKNGYFNEMATNLIQQVILEDSKRYKNHNMAYYNHPTNEIKLALSALGEDKEWQHRWKAFSDAMTFNKDGLTYYEALQTLEQISKPLLVTLENSFDTQISAQKDNKETVQDKILSSVDNLKNDFANDLTFTQEIEKLKSGKNATLRQLATHLERLISYQLNTTSEPRTSKPPAGLRTVEVMLEQVGANAKIARDCESTAPQLFKRLIEPLSRLAHDKNNEIDVGR